MLQNLKEAVRKALLSKDRRRLEEFGLNSSGNYSRDTIDIVIDSLMDSDNELATSIYAKLEAVEKAQKGSTASKSE